MGLSANAPISDNISGSNGLNSGGGWTGYGQSSGVFASGSEGGFNANPNNYANEINQDNAAAGQYYNQGANWQQGAAQAHNGQQGLSQSQLAGTYAGQGALAGQLQKTIADPNSSAAVQQFQAGAKQAQGATTALGNSAGGGLAASGARRDASQANAMQGASNVAAQQQVAAGAQQNAQSQLASLYGQQGQLVNGQYSLEQQNAQKNAQLQQQQMGLNNSTQLGLYGLSANEQGLSTGAVTGYSNDLLGQAGASNSAQQVGDAFGNGVMGAGLSGAGAAYSAASNAYNKNQNGGS